MAWFAASSAARPVIASARTGVGMIGVQPERSRSSKIARNSLFVTTWSIAPVSRTITGSVIGQPQREGVRNASPPELGHQPASDRKPQVPRAARGAHRAARPGRASPAVPRRRTTTAPAVRPRVAPARSPRPPMSPTPSALPLVVSGAVLGQRARFRILLSIRTCGFPAYGLPTVFLTWLRRLRVSDGAHEPVQALAVEPGAGPSVCLAGTQVAAPLLDEQAEQPPPHVPVQGVELDGRVPGADVVAPSPQEQVQPPDDNLQLHPHLAPTGERLDPRSGPLHGPHRRPAMQVVADDPPLLPQPTRHAGVEVATEKVEALLAFPEVDHTGLVRMKAQAEFTQ